MSDTSGRLALPIALNLWATAVIRFRKFAPAGDPIDGPLTGEDHFGPPKADPFGLCDLAHKTAGLALAWLAEPPPTLPDADRTAVVQTAERCQRHLAAIRTSLDASGSFIGAEPREMEAVIGPMARMADVLLAATRDLFGGGITPSFRIKYRLYIRKLSRDHLVGATEPYRRLGGSLPVGFVCQSGGPYSDAHHDLHDLYRAADELPPPPKLSGLRASAAIPAVAPSPPPSPSPPTASPGQLAALFRRAGEMSPDENEAAGAIHGSENPAAVSDPTKRDSARRGRTRPKHRSTNGGLTPTAAELLQALGGAGRSLTGEEIASAAGKPFDYSRQLLADMVKDGLILNDAAGYRLAPGNHAAV